MCGIVGLFIKNAQLRPQLGALLAQMLVVMSDRGPDSAGFAVFGEPQDARVKLTLRAATRFDAATLLAQLPADMRSAIELTLHETHAVVTVPATHEAAFRACVANVEPAVTIVGYGNRMTLFKDVGTPTAVAQRLGLAGMSGTHAIGHTRMATESAVTIDGAHPFSTGRDQCLVHNGSLSNHHELRRSLERDGTTFATDNDSEVAAAYLTGRMQAGRSLHAALTDAITDLDGFYTFVVGTETGFAVLRDPIACKPAVLAETADYVAFGTEYRALAELPGIDTARLWEPEPATVYVWS
jgi:glutamate synthase domain-containing protein 1